MINPPDIWECHQCRYLISDEEMKACRFDYGCPRCKTSFENFTLVPKTKEVNQ